MNRVIMSLMIIVILVAFSYYGTNLVYKRMVDSSDKVVNYKEYKDYGNHESVKTGNMKLKNVNSRISYVIGKPDDNDYKYNYYIKEYESHVAIFNKYGSLYEYTGIVLNSLDETTRNSITEGIYFKDIEDLFTFLESCTS